ncbi:DMT family transporter [Hydrogenophaga sp.]|uniref:DMT family transporter n=1 Tax=Hydrogenophaga sp. TaxID=1904254 RepID=UPI00260702DD|nr:DMT family transporter [Hydrogenophaga sp.]MCW5652645.1 DMT family transporter [Hydrogenophaga sp.]
MYDPRFPHAAQGIALAVLAMLCFALLDTISQYVGPMVPVFMAVWLRFLVQAVMTPLLLWRRQGPAMLRTRAPGWQVLRGSLMLCSSAVAYMSLRHVPVAEFTAILMLVPLIITVLAAPLLRERITPMTWWLVAGGLIGALVVIRPRGGQFQGALLLPLGLVMINAVYQIVTSRMVRTEDPGTTHFYTGLTGLVISSLLLPWTWAALADWKLWVLAALIGVFGSLGHYLLIQAYHRAPASRLTPYMYAQVCFATLLGWLAFGYAPDAWSIAGIVLIALCGGLGVRMRHG